MSKCCCEPVEILITALGPMDDDLRVRVNQTTVFDPRCNVGWYRGEVTERGNVNYNSGYATSGFRVARINIARDVHRVRHCRVVAGTVVSIDVFDGWGGSFQTSPWRADLRWANGATWSTTGGWSSLGSSVITPTTVPADYYSTGPHFLTYIPIGSFIVPGRPPKI